MSEITQQPAAPLAMPILSRGKHKDPSRGACFMEYTALLAGEPFSDAPKCVDPELAAVLRKANDTLSNAHRSLLVPLLGRAIGLAVAPPAGARRGWRRWAPIGRRHDEEAARYTERTARLHQEVAVRFMAAVDFAPTGAEKRRYGRGKHLHGLFAYLMGEPTITGPSETYVRTLVERLYVLHDCYEQAMRELGLPRSTPQPTPDVEAAPGLAHRKPGHPAAFPGS